MCLRSVNHLSSIISEAGADLVEYLSEPQMLSGILGSFLSLWVQYKESLESASEPSYTVPLEHSGRCGRPRFVVSREQLEYLCSLSFSWMDIASLLGMSRMTVY